jgi:hypothetical protein
MVWIRSPGGEPETPPGSKDADHVGQPSNQVGNVRQDEVGDDGIEGGVREGQIR